MDQGQLTLKGNLDFARTHLVRGSVWNINDQEQASPLSWGRHESKEGNAVCVSNLISSEEAGFPLLIVAIKGERVPPTIGDLLAVYQPSIRTLAVRFQKTPEERYVIPIEVLTSSWEAAVTACHAYSVDPFIPGTDHVYTWDRYLGDLRRAWKQAMTSAILAKTNGHCWYCGEKLVIGAIASGCRIPGKTLTASEERRKFHVDHQTPLSSGRTDDLENLVPCCRTCNIGKGARSLLAYRESVASKALNGFPDLSPSQQCSLIESYLFWGERQP